jgi:putative aldouronate transport system substrate-binding protein
MKRTIALLLALAMVFAMAACGGTASTTTTESTETTAAETTAAAEESAEPAAEAPAAAESEAPAQDDAAPAEESEAPAEEATDEVQLLEPLSYPVSDGSVQLTYWYSYPPFVPNFLDDVSDKEIYRAIDDAVGVDIKVVGYSLINASEQFQLMIASSDYTDIIYGFGSNYSGSLEGAVEDEIILDLSDKLEEYAPDYANYLLSDPEVNMAAHTDAGYVPSFCGINDDDLAVNGGLIIRTDYLDAVGMDMPTTYDELEDVLTAFKDQLGVEAPYWSNPSGYVVEMTAGYDLSPGFYVQDDVVKYGFYEDSFYDYLTMMKRWYDNGLLYHDFASQSSMQQFPESDLVNNNKVGVWFNSLNEMTAYDNTTSTDPNFAITGLPVPSLEKGATTHFETINAKVATTSGNFISTNCKDVELAMAWCNYWYTEEGTLLANYGIQGETWDYNENGEPQFTDLVVGNPDLAFDIAISVYCEFNGGGYYVLNAKTDSNYNEVQLGARENWMENSDTAYNYPGYASLNAEESQIYAGCIGDVTTYIEEMVLKFITGNTDLNEQTFADYKETLKSFGVEDCIEVYQAAYDRYLER